MGKPSMFSKNYEQQLRQRRINIFLVVLILLFGGLFTGKYYLDKYNIKIFDFSKINTPSNKSNTTTKTPTEDNAQKQTKPDNTEKQNNIALPNADLNYEYKSPNGNTFKVYYTNDNGSKTITKLDSSGNKPTYDISSDKKKIVFDDILAGSIILGDSDGNFKPIEIQSYTSKSAGLIIEKAKTLADNPTYVWAAAPHFTADGRVIYVTSLPFVYKGANLSIWVLSLDDSSYKMLGQLTTSDLSKVSYDSIDADGKIKIKSDADTFYLAPQGTSLSN